MFLPFVTLLPFVTFLPFAMLQYFDINTILFMQTNMPTIHATLINKMKTVRININVNFLHPIKLCFEEGHYPL